MYAWGGGFGLPALLALTVASFLLPPLVFITVPLKVVVVGLLAAWDFLDYPFSLRSMGLRARLLLLPPHDPQFRRNRERVVRDAERENLFVVKEILRLVGKGEELIKYVTDRPGHDRRYAIDATKLETELGWRAKEDFESGIERTIRWYLDNEWWWRPLRERYDGQRLGL